LVPDDKKVKSEIKLRVQLKEMSLPRYREARKKNEITQVENKTLPYSSQLDLW